MAQVTLTVDSKVLEDLKRVMTEFTMLLEAATGETQEGMNEEAQMDDQNAALTQELEMMGRRP